MTYIGNPPYGPLVNPTVPWPWVYPHLGTTITIGDHTRTSNEWWETVTPGELKAGDVIWIDCSDDVGTVCGVVQTDDDYLLLLRVNGKLRTDSIGKDHEPADLWRKVS